jgi:hypothetical protein
MNAVYLSAGFPPVLSCYFYLLSVAGTSTGTVRYGIGIQLWCYNRRFWVGFRINWGCGLATFCIFLIRIQLTILCRYWYVLENWFFKITFQHIHISAIHSSVTGIFSSASNIYYYSGQYIEIFWKKSSLEQFWEKKTFNWSENIIPNVIKISCQPLGLQCTSDGREKTIWCIFFY